MLIGLVILLLVLVPSAAELKQVNLFAGGFLLIIGAIFYFLGQWQNKRQTL
ncbi:hypothetical protein GX408_12575, partial [bacterium]|nr:hypothetical protein [bacterium]